MIFLDFYDSDEDVVRDLHLVSVVWVEILCESGLGRPLLAPDVPESTATRVVVLHDAQN